ncbi:MAG: ABC transporter substrate-binding protein [Actinomycetota bacterium]
MRATRDGEVSYMRAERAWHLRLLALLTVLMLVAAACGGDDTETTGDDDGGDVPVGGDLVIGAEQEPDCTAWIKSCAGSSWGYWMMGTTTMPRAFDTLPDGEAWAVVASADLLTGEPEVDDSDPASPVHTYSINPDAVWSDGEPITCDDFVFTWDAIVNGEEIYDPTGYVDVSAVDCPDPNTAVVTFSKPYAGWKELFGGGYGILPAHILEGQDILEAMRNGYTWSAGPWMLDHWTKGVEAQLVPNPNWWGEAPKLDSVTFKFQADTAAEFQSFQNREVSMIYPQPQLDVVDQIEAGIEGARSAYTTTNSPNSEAIWMNNAAPPLDEVAVRQAIAYAVDRAAIVEQLFGALGVDAPLNTLNAPILVQFSDPDAFAGYVPDLTMVDELMTGAGWEKNADGIWEKDGTAANLTFKSTAGNQRRERTGQILQEQLGEAGFGLTLDYQDAGALFGEQLPQGDFQLALYAQVLTALKVGQCNIFCSKNIPVEETEFSGQNWTRTDIPELDALLEELDTTIDEERQAEIGREADAIQAEQVVSLPLDPLPNILIWADNVKGPVMDNPILGPFWNLHLVGVEA